jgi:hypothetical protein
MLPRVRSIQPETAEALRAFAASGGKLIFVGEVPSQSVGRADHEARDRQVSETMKKLRADHPDHAILVNEPEGPIIDWFAAIQQKCGLTPFVRFDHPVNHVSQVHYKAGDADIYFIANYDMDNPHTFTATFNPEGKIPWIWNPETGEKSRYPSYGDMSTLKISLDPAASVLICYTPEKKGPEYAPRQSLDGQSFPLSGTWDVTLEKVYGKPREVKDFTLRDFKDELLRGRHPLQEKLQGRGGLRRPVPGPGESPRDIGGDAERQNHRYEMVRLSRVRHHRRPPDGCQHAGRQSHHRAG